LAASLDRNHHAPGWESLFYEAAIDPLLEQHLLTAVRIEPGHAIEIDTPEDYQRAQRFWSA
jgi:CTP:molybdopterin cytidylyltransferase MocA